MKQALASVLAGYQGLGSTDDQRERPVDRLAALGMAQASRAHDAAEQSFLCSLGGDLIAFKYGNRAPSKKDAEDKLAIAMRWRRWNLKLSGREFDRIARWAVQEWVIDLCPVCKGAKEIPDHHDREGKQPMKSCPPTPTGCGGTGKRHYSDSERIEAMGEAFAKAMSQAHGILGLAESMAIRLVKDRLGRVR